MNNAYLSVGGVSGSAGESEKSRFRCLQGPGWSSAYLSCASQIVWRPQLQCLTACGHDGKAALVEQGALLGTVQARVVRRLALESAHRLAMSRAAREHQDGARGRMRPEHGKHLALVVGAIGTCVRKRSYPHMQSGSIAQPGKGQSVVCGICVVNLCAISHLLSAFQHVLRRRIC